MVANLSAFMEGLVGVFEIGGVAVKRGQIGTTGVARGEMIQRAAGSPKIIEGVGSVKGNFTGVGAHVGKKRRMPRNAIPPWP